VAAVDPLGSRGVADLKEIVQLVEDDLVKVEELFEVQCRSDVGLVGEIGRYIREGGGKRIRPALLLLACRACGFRGERAIVLASVVEFIHTATLLHDDIIDQATVRRGRRSVNSRWGNDITVLLGDFLYTKSMSMALSQDNLRILRLLSDVTLRMIEGELLEIERNGDLAMREADHVDIIRRKTADLFSAACRLPAHFAPRGDLFAAERLAEYGRCLGVAFQLIDDMLDYTSSEETVGKPVLNDLREGKLTMPLLFTLPRASAAERERVATVAREREFRTVEPSEILSLVERADGIGQTRALARDYAAAARVALTPFPASEAKEGLMLATESVIDRVN